MKSLLTITAIAFLAAGLNASAEDGKAVYSKQCAKCHGDDGKGATPMGKKLSIKDLAADQAKLSDAQIEKAIKEGIEKDGKTRMKALKDLSAEDVKAVVKHVRTLK